MQGVNVGKKDVDCIRSGFRSVYLGSGGAKRDQEFFHTRLGRARKFKVDSQSALFRDLGGEGSRPMLRGACAGNTLSANRVAGMCSIGRILQPTLSGGITT